MNHLPLPPITHEAELMLLARAESSRTIRIDETRIIDPNQIIHLTSKYFGVDEELLKSKSRKREVVLIRQCLMWYIHKELNYSQEKSGAFFGRDHATVIHACRRIENVATDSALLPVFTNFVTFIGSTHTAIPASNQKHTDSNIFSIMLRHFGRNKAIPIYGKDFRDFLEDNFIPRVVVVSSMKRLAERQFIHFMNEKKTWFKIV